MAHMMYRCNNCNSWFEEPKICFNPDYEPKYEGEYECCPECESRDFDYDEELDTVYTKAYKDATLHYKHCIYHVIRMAKQYNADAGKILEMLEEVTERVKPYI